LHCAGASTPTYGTNGTVAGLSASFIPEIKQLATMAQQHEVVLMIALWSFDMFKGDGTNGLHADLVSDPAKTHSYIDNALIPMMNALNSYNNIIYEVMNEPEWAIKGPGNTKVQVPLNEMQRFAAMIAEAVHTHSKAPITMGSACLKWNSAAVPPAEANYWSDAGLNSAYPSATGKLDFYQIHYYDWMHSDDWGYDPCRKDTTFWKLDKPTVVGELPSTGGNFYSPIQIMNCSYNNGFIGTQFWSYNSDWPWTSAQPALNAFYNAHATVSSYQTLVNWLNSLRM